ncbi:MAG TPA: DUF2231 domain-containing protein [Gemmatimonadales bacterium]
MFGYDWPRFHAAVNDLPAALLLVTVLFDLAGWLTKRASLKAAALWTLWAGVIGGWVAVLAGLQAEEAIQHGKAIHELMEQHERQALVTMGIFTVVLVWKLYRRFDVPRVEELVLRGLSVLGVIGLLYTAAAGGKLVFEHAAGIPDATMQAELENREAGHHHDAEADSTKPAGHTHAPGTPEHRH